MDKEPNVTSDNHEGAVEGGQGRVIRKSGRGYFVEADSATVECVISSKMRKELEYPTADASSRRPSVANVKERNVADPVVVGDIVVYAPAGEGKGMITSVLPRCSKFSRQQGGRRSREQVMAANIDQVAAVFAAARPEPKWGMLDRYLIGTEACELSALICINKMDLVEESTITDVMKVYEKIGYPVVLTSAITGRGMDDFKAAMKDKVSVLVGKSGVGKSTLLNAVQPGLDLPVGEVGGRKTGHKGRHTTTHREWLELAIGGAVIDTPGIRELGLWEVDYGNLAELFPEMRPLLGQCRFGADCRHLQEPDCAIKAAVESGEIAESRYRSFVTLSKD